VRTLRADGLVLEPQVAAHAAELFAVLDDADLYAFIDDKGPASEGALRERLARLENRVSPDGSQAWLNWVVRNADGAVIGYVQATVKPDHQAEIAYVVGRNYWRRGYAFAACSAMLGALATTYGVTRATATLDPDNAASLALLRKLAFRFDSEDAAAHEVHYARALQGAS
jgi:RimJ/RimL family protein N-acetyltransferase